MADKHDADCLRRKVEMNFPYLCTCALTDDQVDEARRKGSELYEWAHGSAFREERP